MCHDNYNYGEDAHTGDDGDAGANVIAMVIVMAMAMTRHWCSRSCR